jgi:hypothetical protein
MDMDIGVLIAIIVFLSLLTLLCAFLWWDAIARQTSNVLALALSVILAIGWILLASAFLT